MNRFAQNPPEERAVFIAEAAARLGVQPVIVEKDFWVTWTLARLFQCWPNSPTTVDWYWSACVFNRF